MSSKTGEKTSLVSSLQSERSSVYYGGASYQSDSSRSKSPRSDKLPLTRISKSKTVTEKKRRRPFSDLFRYATAADYALIVAGSIFSIIHGAGFPVLAIIFGGMTDAFLRVQAGGFIDNATTPQGLAKDSSIVNASYENFLSSIPRDQFLDMMIEYSLYYTYIGLAMFLTSYGQITCWQMACERQIFKLRQKFFYTILREEIAWFDNQPSGELTSRLSDDIERIKEGIGDKFSMFVQFMSTFVAGFAIGFANNWKLTLVIMSITPLLALSGAILAVIMSSATKREQTAYAAAGAIAEEVLSCVRTVIAFNGQQREVTRYENALERGKKIGVKKYIYMGFSIGFMMLCMFAAYGLAFWYGSTLIVSAEDEFTRGTVFTVLFSVMAGSFAIGQSSSHFSALSNAKGAAATIYDIIDDTPAIDSYCKMGSKPVAANGRIAFNNVFFAYPTRKDALILRGINLAVEPGQTVALVGPSGCGKSTIANLLLRFYDVNSGSITIDGKELVTYNIRWLRRLVGIVSQEPVLFNATIEENIRYGRADISREEIVHVAKLANAHDFIKRLPKSYETNVGERGAQLSGGQKQRIAIARALARDPRILILDEATSALDAESEGVVQAALETASRGRTTIIIAHRLSTIQNADLILALQDGQIAEQGTHEELMSKRGLYYDLVQQQSFASSSTGSDQESEEDKNTDNDDGFHSIALAAKRHRYRRTKSTSFAAVPLKRHSASVGNLGSRSQKSSMAGLGISVGQGPLSRLYSKAESVVSLSTDVMLEKRLRDQLEEEKLQKASMKKIVKLNIPQLKYMAFGFLGSLINGSIMPAFALFYSEMIAVYSLEGEALQRGARFWALMFLALGAINAIGQMIAMYAFGTAGENVTMNLRTKVFLNVLRQDVAYFDDERHATGKICTRLATDAPTVRFVWVAFGGRMAAFIGALIAMVAGIIIAFLYGWKLALLMSLMLPILLAAGFLDLKMKMANQSRDTQLMEEAGKTACEAIENIRTVQVLTQERTFYEKYCEHLLRPFRENIKQAHIYGLGFGFSQCVMFFLYAASFRFGAYLVDLGEMEALDVYRVFFAIQFTGQSVGQMSSFVPDIVKARLSAALIFHMIDYPPRIDSYAEGGLRPEIKGNIRFNDVVFGYPSRPTVRVLRGLNFSVPAGKTVALVGVSGCGKSTVVCLLERFYDPQHGEILIDGVDIRTLNLRNLRSHISVVSQEPILFDCSIRDNIAYGLNGGVSHERIVAAAKLANAHDFIISLPQGYNTNVGEKGQQMSGGQKQRIAIARALIRNPKILLLDEATSALDAESEKVVQEALDRAREGRTCIVIAHRLSTIQNADLILVIKDGKVVEKGTHNELIARKDAYFNLVKKQSLKED